jgi:hypothetical protein
MLQFSALLTKLTTRPTWPDLWSAANKARDAGRPEKALELYAEALAASPDSPDPYLEAGIHGLKVNLAFRGVDDLYRRHAVDFGLPESSELGVFDRLSAGRYSWSFALSALLRASALAPAAGYQRLLAQAFSHFGQPQHALAILRQIQGTAPVSLRDDREYGRLLARSNPANAVFYYQGLLVRWPSAADLPWHLLAAQIDSCAESEAQATYAALLRDLAARDTPDDRQVHGLALLAWAMYVRPVPVMAQRALADFAPLFALAGKLYPSSAAAQLATGFGALLEGRLKTGKQALALATLPRHTPASDNDDAASSNDARPNLIEPLETAIRALLPIDDMAPANKATTAPLPNDAHEHISAMQAGALLREQDLFGALKLFGDAIAPHVVRKPYNSSETVLDRRIVYHQGKFYALPHMIGNFTILNGMVYRIPEQMHIMRPTMPRLLMRIARPIVTHMIRLMSRYSLLRSLGRFTLRIALSGYAVRDVLVDNDFDAVVVKVRNHPSPLPGLFSAEFGTIDFATSNSPRTVSALVA